MKGCLGFEHQGLLHLVTPSMLQEVFAAGGSYGKPVVVFVSACESETAGRAFVKAGAKHVVAIEASTKLWDSAAAQFTHQFYLALVNNRVWTLCPHPPPRHLCASLQQFDAPSSPRARSPHRLCAKRLILQRLLSCRLPQCPALAKSTCCCQSGPRSRRRPRIKQAAVVERSHQSLAQMEGISMHTHRTMCQKAATKMHTTLLPAPQPHQEAAPPLLALALHPARQRVTRTISVCGHACPASHLGSLPSRCTQTGCRPSRLPSRAAAWISSASSRSCCTPRTAG